MPEHNVTTVEGDGYISSGAANGDRANSDNSNNNNNEEEDYHPERQRIVVKTSNTSTLYAWNRQIENIACPPINEYYFGVPQQDEVQASL